MGYFSKEIYQRKVEWRHKRNEEQKNKKILSEECCDAIEELQTARHNFHCGSTFLTESADFNLSEKLYEEINNINSFQNETGIKCENFDWTFLPDDRDDNREESEEEHDEIKETVNDNVRDFIEKINEKFGLNY